LPAEVVLVLSLLGLVGLVGFDVSNMSLHRLKKDENPKQLGRLSYKNLLNATKKQLFSKKSENKKIKHTDIGLLSLYFDIHNIKHHI